MTIKQQLTQIIQAATNVVVYWDTTPEGFAPNGPFIVAQQVGGKRNWYVDDTEDFNKHARIQFTCFTRRRLDTDALAAGVENAIRNSSLVAEPYGAPIDGYESPIKMHTAAQQFGFNYAV